MLGRSSFRVRVTSSAVVSVPFVSTVPTGFGAPVVLVLLNKLPDPSSLIVAIPALPAVIALPTPPVFVAVNVKVSPLSDGTSLMIAVRTNSVVPSNGICTKLFGM